MAVTITVAALAAAIRVGDSTEETAEVTRLLAYSTEAVTRHLGASFATTPEAVVNEAVVRLSAYLYDAPHAQRSAHEAIRQSGATGILSPYRVHRAGVTSGEPAAATTGGTGTTPSGPGEDDVARRAAAEALAAAEDAQGAAEAAQTAAETAANPETATADEADAATETGLRSWSAALIRRVVEAIVPSWARATNPPAQDVLHLADADVFHGNANVISLRNVPDTSAGQRYGFFVEKANTAATEVVVGSTTRPLITNEGDALTGGELVVGEFIEIVDDGTSFRIIGGSATGHTAATPEASESQTGTVTLAREVDVADSETDLTRVPTVSRAIALIRRLIGENVRSIPEAEASHVGRPLVATRDSSPWGAWQRLGTDGYDDASVTEAKLAQAVKDKLIPATGLPQSSLAQAVQDKLDARRTSTDQMARDAAAAAILDGMTVIEVGPNFVHNETGPKTLSLNIRHPLGAYSRARIMSVSVAGQPVVLVGYDHTVLHQDTLAEIAATSFTNIWAQMDAIPDGQGGTTNVQRWPVGSYLPVEVRLLTGRGGDTVFSRVLDVPVVAQPSYDDLADKPTIPAGTTRTKIGGTTTFTRNNRVNLSTTDAAAVVTAWNSGTYSRLLLEFARTEGTYSQAEIWITGNVANGGNRSYGFAIHFPVHSPDDPAEGQIDINRVSVAAGAVSISAFDNPFANGTTLTIWGISG